MSDKFILPRRGAYGQKGTYPVVRVHKDTYAILAELAAESGLPVSSVVTQAVEFAVTHLVLVDETDIGKEQ